HVQSRAGGERGGAGEVAPGAGDLNVVERADAARGGDAEAVDGGVVEGQAADAHIDRGGPVDVEAVAGTEVDGDDVGPRTLDFHRLGDLGRGRRALDAERAREAGLEGDGVGGVVALVNYCDGLAQRNQGVVGIVVGQRVHRDRSWDFAALEAFQGEMRPDS